MGRSYGLVPSQVTGASQGRTVHRETLGPYSCTRLLCGSFLKEVLMSVYEIDSLEIERILTGLNQIFFNLFVYSWPPGNQGRYKQDQQVTRFLHLAEHLKLPELKKKVWYTVENQYNQSKKKTQRRSGFITWLYTCNRSFTAMAYLRMTVKSGVWCLLENFTQHATKTFTVFRIFIW